MVLGFPAPFLLRSADGLPAGNSFKITIPSGRVGSNLTGFPVWVNLADMVASFWSTVAAAGADIRVYDSAYNAIPFDLVHIDLTNKIGTLFFKADLASGSDNDFYIFTGTGLTAPAVGDPLGRNAVWSFATVAIHGRQNADRTGNGATITLGNNAAFSGDRIIFDGTGDYVRITSSAATQWSAYCLGQIGDAAAATNSAIMSFGPWQTADTNRVTIGHRISTDKWGAWNTTNSWLDGNASVQDNDMFSLAYVHNNGVKRELFNYGASMASQVAGAVAALPTGTTECLLGCEDQTLNEDLNGIIRLFYKTHTLLSADWIAAADKNYRTPRLFYNVDGVTYPDANTLVLVKFDDSTPRNLVDGKLFGARYGSMTCDPPNQTGQFTGGYCALAADWESKFDQTTDWTLEFHADMAAADSGGSFSKLAAGTSRYLFWHAGGGTIELYNRNASILSMSGVNGTQRHWAVVKQSGTYRLYRDGVQQASIGGQSASAASAESIWLGTDIFSAGARTVSMNMKRFKISNNARYPNGTTFTPPAVTDP